MSHETRLFYLDSIIGNNDTECINQLRIDRRTFQILCELLRMDGKIKLDGSSHLKSKCVFSYTYLPIMSRIAPYIIGSSVQAKPLIGILMRC